MGPTCHPETLATTYYQFEQHNKQTTDKIFHITTYLRRNRDNLRVERRKLLKMELKETECNSMN